MLKEPGFLFTRAAAVARPRASEEVGVVAVWALAVRFIPERDLWGIVISGLGIQNGSPTEMLLGNATESSTAPCDSLGANPGGNGVSGFAGMELYILVGFSWVFRGVS